MLSSQNWAVDGFLASPEARVAVGVSIESVLTPGVEAQCETFITAVMWHIDDPSLASLAPRGRSVWITGMAQGSTAVGARITLGDGIARDARPRGLRVVPPESRAGGQIVAEGSLTIPPYVPPGTADRAWSGWVPFTTQAAGRLDVVVDWVSPLNSIDFSGYEGHCNSIGSCGRIRLTVRDFFVKPLIATFDDPRTPPGAYTIRIDNLGPGEETVRYEVRLMPS